MALGQYASKVGESGWSTQRLGRLICLFFLLVSIELGLNTRAFYALLWLYILIILGLCSTLFFSFILALGMDARLRVGCHDYD